MLVVIEGLGDLYLSISTVSKMICHYDRHVRHSAFVKAETRAGGSGYLVSSTLPPTRLHEFKGVSK